MFVDAAVIVSWTYWVGIKRNEGDLFGDGYVKRVEDKY